LPDLASNASRSPVNSSVKIKTPATSGFARALEGVLALRAVRIVPDHIGEVSNLSGRCGPSGLVQKDLHHFIGIGHLGSSNSSSAPRSAGGYSQAVDISGVQRLLFVSGQIPETVTGDVPADFAAQARLVWQNVIAQLEVAGMSISNLVKVTTYLSSREFAVANRGVREEVLQGHAPALTVIVAGIFDEKWLLEIEAIAAA
jgi:2-iminobutanoate/2-iminopropanoate deaminase